MGSRKIWVKRPGSSATLVTINNDDLVDDVREMILKKYANSLGRSFDAPDVTLRIVPRDHTPRHSRDAERTLGPEESMSRTLDEYFPQGQRVDEALIIDVPHRRTPKPSPRQGHHLAYYPEELRPGEGDDYFPPMPAMTSPRLPSAPTSTINNLQTSFHQQAPAISVLSSGHIAPVSSPGSRVIRHHGRPRMARNHTSSPPIVPSASNPLALESKQAPPVPPPLPASPAAETMHKVGTPPAARASSPRPSHNRKNGRQATHPQLPPGLLEGAVPPINVLIVEDNIINLKLLEAFMKRLKVRWQTAMNGRDAVRKWRTGGFHLVLMDIQLPIMNGLEATKEIRRLERLNSIGVFSSSASSSAPEAPPGQGPEGDDKLPNTILFKSPVIIVALTASSLQSDRHEALAAGCNDFLTKPVNFVWLERKVMEWGCMQALIDFDGWRKWKDFSQHADDEGAKPKGAGGIAGKAVGNRIKRDKMRTSTGSTAGADNIETPKSIVAGA
ncbi:MAG: ssk1 response regulator receiver [Caeruleum heppii]|nr:MAG: ssk1 response regulator receiver [Caeruleum heppii]